MASATAQDAAVKANAASVKASDVRAAFAEAGLSPDAINHILTRYQPA